MTGYYTSDENLLAAGGQYYGSLYRPLHRGSAGGKGKTTEGGSGGGYIDLQVNTICHFVYGKFQTIWFNFYQEICMVTDWYN